MSFQRPPDGAFRHHLFVDLLHALAGVLVGIWLPLVIVEHDLGLDQRLALAVDMVLFLIAGTSAAFSWKKSRGWRQGLRIARDVAVALPLWTLFHEDAPSLALWAAKCLAVFYVLRL